MKRMKRTKGRLRRRIRLLKSSGGEFQMKWQIYYTMRLLGLDEPKLARNVKEVVCVHLLLESGLFRETVVHNDDEH